MQTLTWGSLITLAITATACHHPRPPATMPARTMASPPAATPRAATVSAAAPTPRRVPAPLSEAELFGRKSLDELNAEHPLADVFFEYDKNALREDARRILQQDAQWLAKWPQTRIRIDGHCDERGTPEYNLALGDRRASTAQSYLTSLGVRPERIQIRSLGNEAPFCHDTGESCWSQNRRGHFVITGK